MNKEYLNVLLADNDKTSQIVFKNIFKDLKIGLKIQTFSNGEDLMEYLNNEEVQVPEIVFMSHNIPNKSSLEYLEKIRMDPRFSNMVTAVYSEDLSEEEVEDIFVKGANVYIKKKDDYNALKKVISEVITINWQYHSSGLNKDNFIMRV
ncbi:CheY-like chemotaxis protein [Chryseobacterium sp. H1D6B]|uniref:response regulator n=1 Tax=Chryseobacterium sp. H1D6B TaxID=2940588 RepID=UPI0015CE593E|nr:response regulator [Chryseobacterium sp. H1D6B]MDH6252614.1 CheY-like chemotaxis protein [Chryseobacterium sp. H1D6B]